MQFVLAWFCILGFKMSWQKAAYGPEIDWIVAHLSTSELGVWVGIPDSKVLALRSELDEHIHTHALAIRRARSLAGGAGFIAGIIPW